MQRMPLPILLLAIFVSAFVYFEPTDSPDIQEKNVRAHMEFLAGEALQGRGSGTQHEHIAAQYVAAQLRQFGIEPAGEASANGKKTFLQTITLTKRAFSEAPRLRFSLHDKTLEWTHGQEIVLAQASSAEFSGPLQKLAGNGPVKPGSFVLLTAPENSDRQALNQSIGAIVEQKPAAVLVPVNPAWQQYWSRLAARLPQLPSEATGDGRNVIFLSAAAAQQLQQISDGTLIQLQGQAGAAEKNYTWNAVGVLPGSDSKLSQEAIVLSAHLDHLGVGRSVSGDSIYNGADDDASGVTAVLELARVLGAGPKPKRAVYFALFGSEERGGHGSQHFLKNPPVPLDQIIADLQFEMIGRPDPKVPANTLWLTGYERSNLGPELAKHGAALVADPHPEENFFQRSDNYAFARLGVVAHTVSSYGLHEEYHQPNDDLSHIDFAHMTRAINSMIESVQWLVNSNFIPTWVEGKKP
jgi:hypothetical protein